MSATSVAHVQRHAVYDSQIARGGEEAALEQRAVELGRVGGGGPG
jgi:hypothetical protein